MNILVTGATGYIGHRLASGLLSTNHSLRLFVRNKLKLDRPLLSRCQIIEGDTFNENDLNTALCGIDVAYYLVHSMGKTGDYDNLDKVSAMLFRDACIRNGVKKVIYLGGLGEKDSASLHLKSRIETGEILSEKPDQLTVIWFRAGVIIGSGSASFEIVRHLVQKLPILVTPKWVHTRTQPISIDDVIQYLTSALSTNINESIQIDIGADILSFKQMLLQASDVMKLNRRIIEVPVLSPTLSSYWLILITPITYSIAGALVQGLKSESIVLNNTAKKIMPHITPTPYKDAFQHAIDELLKDQVMSSWCDSSGGKACDIPYVFDIAKATFKDTYHHDITGIDQPSLFNAILNIGGTAGWQGWQWLWEIRGLFDKLIGGYGLNRGKRSQSHPRIGDSLDFWKVIDIVENKRLLLEAQMKVPGKAWLEFQIIDNTFTQTAHFYPKGLFGRTYWYLMLPFHKLIFNHMSKQLIQTANSNTNNLL